MTASALLVAAFRRPSRAQAAQLLLGVLQTLLQRLLGLAEAGLGVALDLVDQDERPVGFAARRAATISASPPARVPTRLATNGPLSLNGVMICWPKKSCDAHPEPVGQDVAVGDHDHVGRPVGLRLMGGEVRRPLLVLGQCPAGPGKADFSTPRTRAAITRRSPSGLKSARIRAGFGFFTSLDRTCSRIAALLVSSGMNSIVGPSAFAGTPTEATVTWVRSTRGRIVVVQARRGY